ncbi:MAG: hypothetical protein ACREKR_01385 [Candidatus Methylomirabilales bacterium]
MAKKFYAYCDTRKHPHVKDSASGTYLPWQSSRYDKHPDAKKEADNHNKNAGHNAIVLSATG